MSLHATLKLLASEYSRSELYLRLCFAELDELWDQRECAQLCPYYLDIQGEQMRLQVLQTLEWLPMILVACRLVAMRSCKCVAVLRNN